MASISSDKQGRRRIQFVNFEKQRKTIRLGKVSMKIATEVCGWVEKLNEAKKLSVGIGPAAAAWVASLSKEFRDKLVTAGLVEPSIEELKAKVPTLGEFIKRYVASRTDAKPATHEVWRQAVASLESYFKKETVISDITPGMADEFKRHLVGKYKSGATVRKRLQFGTMLFRAAMRLKLIQENPFAGVTVKVAPSEKKRFITRAELEMLLDACNGVDWRLIVALTRLAGLRTPNETLSLRWCDVFWDKSMMLVTSHKTAHHPGKETRLVPIVPRLMELLQEAFEQAEEGEVYVVDEKYRLSANTPGGWRNCNLRTTFEKIVERSGVKGWAMPFRAMRSSWEIEMNERFPIHVVAAWAGHSVNVAQENYLSTTDTHFAEAAKYQPDVNIPEAAQNAAQLVPNQVSKCQQNENGEDSKQQENKHTPTFADVCLYLNTCKADGVGFEPTVRFRVQQFSRLPP